MLGHLLLITTDLKGSQIMDEMETRLRAAADNCIKFYAAWRTSQKDGKAREEMMEAVHELRKVAARLEIEMAISERDEMSSRPIAIPPHRASRKRPGQDDDNGNDGNGNRLEQPPQQHAAGPRPGGHGGHRRRPGGHQEG
jgi:hypothetical protein